MQIFRSQWQADEAKLRAQLHSFEERLTASQSQAEETAAAISELARTQTLLDSSNAAQAALQSVNTRLNESVASLQAALAEASANNAVLDEDILHVKEALAALQAAVTTEEANAAATLVGHRATVAAERQRSEVLAVQLR